MTIVAKNQKRIILIAGPNGGKQPRKLMFAAIYPPILQRADSSVTWTLICAEAEAFQAGKIMLNQIALKVEAGRSFALETTLSGRSYARQIPGWKQMGYHVTLIFLSLPAVALAMTRVKSRVAQGGHSIPEMTIRRRFDAGLRNFESLYREIVNYCLRQFH